MTRSHCYLLFFVYFPCAVSLLPPRVVRLATTRTPLISLRIGKRLTPLTIPSHPAHSGQTNPYHGFHTECRTAFDTRVVSSLTSAVMDALLTRAVLLLLPSPHMPTKYTLCIATVPRPASLSMCRSSCLFRQLQSMSTSKKAPQQGSSTEQSR